MKPIRILVDSFADAGLPNAQMGNAREIMYRLDPGIFHVSTFMLGKPDARIAARKSTRLIQLPERRQTIRILSEFLLGSHELLFYMKSSPASRCYLSLRDRWRDHRVTIGTIESQCDFEREPGVTPQAVRLWKQTILRCDHLYSNSDFVRSSLKETYGRNSEVIPTGADTQFFTPDWDRVPNSRPQVLFVGSLRQRKHPDIVVSAAALFPGADFRIAGEGILRDELNSRITRAGLKNVTLTGLLRAEELRQEYRRSDIFFFPSTFEGSPKVIVEAAASGLPVVIRNTYSAETVIHNVTGFLCASNEEMFSFLKVLLDRPELRRKFGEAGRLHSKKFDWDVLADRWARTFLALAPSQRMRRAS